jgi:hypothetical protein
MDIKVEYGGTLSLPIGHRAAVKPLLEKDADVDSESSYYSRCGTPLLLAAQNKHEAVVKLPLKDDVDVNFRDEYGRMPLIVADGE